MNRAPRRGQGPIRVYRYTGSPHRRAACRSSRLPAFADLATVGLSWYFLEFSRKSPRQAHRHSRRLHDCHSRHLVSGFSVRRVSCDLNHTASHYTPQGCRPNPQRAPRACLALCGFVQPPFGIRSVWPRMARRVRRVSCDHNHTASHYTSQGCRRTPAARPARMFVTLRFVLPPILLWGEL